jgi:plastocyanin
MNNMKILKYFIPCFFFSVILAAGCSKDAKQKLKPVTHTVVISGMQFHPAELSVNKGDTVKWVNKDLVTHNVTDYPGKEWTSGPINPGSSWKKVVKKDLNYYCSIHPAMKGKIKTQKEE